MSGALVDTMAEGRIQKALSGFYYVDTGAEVLTCRARGKFRKEGLSPLVGDRVTVRELGNGEGFVESILPRKNAFERPAVANIDQLVVIGSAAIPKTDPFLIDRIAAIAALKGCEVVVLLKKCDLDPEEELYRIYTAAGFPTLRISAETGEGLEELIPLITGKLSAFTGNSGVGKSSILNALDPAFQLKTGEISTALGRGRHTTRHVELFRLSCGAEIMDSPGFSSFETEELNLELKHRLPETFREFAPYLGECQFLDCSHTKEKGCAVREALEAGKLQPSRYQSYLRVFEELKPLREWTRKSGNKYAHISRPVCEMCQSHKRGRFSRVPKSREGRRLKRDLGRPFRPVASGQCLGGGDRPGKKPRRSSRRSGRGGRSRRPVRRKPCGFPRRCKSAD